MIDFYCFVVEKYVFGEEFIDVKGCNFGWIKVGFNWGNVLKCIFF